ncbi:MAG: 30S ribosomal protein S16 [Candidatus Peregrinibacteria bacterium]
MLRIRLQRTGRNKTPFYRIVVAEHSAPVKAKFVERLGNYNPLANPKVFELDEKKLEEWIKKGAQPSSTLARLLKGKGMKGMEKYIQNMPDRKKKKDIAADKAAGGKVPEQAGASAEVSPAVKKEEKEPNKPVEKSNS